MQAQQCRYGHGGAEGVLVWIHQSGDRGDGVSTWRGGDGDPLDQREMERCRDTEGLGEGGDGRAGAVGAWGLGMCGGIG